MTPAQSLQIQTGQVRPAILLTAIPARMADIGIRVGIAILDISNPLIRKVALNHHRLMKPARWKLARVMVCHRVRTTATANHAPLKALIAPREQRNIR